MANISGIDLPRGSRGARNRSNLCPVLLFIVACLVAIALFAVNTHLALFLFNDPDGASPGAVTSYANDDPSTVADDSAALKLSRNAIVDTCHEQKTPDILRRVTSEMFMQLPATDDTVSPARTPRPDVRKCRNVFLDFGANVGDTAGKIIDAGLPNCIQNKRMHGNGVVRFDLDERAIVPLRWNRISKFILLTMTAKGLWPEDYCYYGLEGNPVFTDRLRKLEDWLGAIRPRPFKHAAFFTESVGTGSLGPTKLYLDTVNANRNYWGSSIMEGHQDVQKSKGNLTEAPHHDVMGYTITKLMEMTLEGMDADASDDAKKGSHLFIKCDIEGGEYVLLREAMDSNALCRFVEMGNAIDLIIETHSQRVTGQNSLAREFPKWKKKLEECGVNFVTLPANFN